MDTVKKYQNNLVTAVFAAVLGFISKRALSLPSVGANGFQPAITSFVVVGVSAAAADYLIAKEEHRG